MGEAGQGRGIQVTFAFRTGFDDGFLIAQMLSSATSHQFRYSPIVLL